MSTQADETGGLAELLARAAVIEQETAEAELKAATAVAEPEAAAPAPLTPDALIDLAAQQAAESVRAELAEEVAGLREMVEALQASSPPGVDPQADADAGTGTDFDALADDDLAREVAAPLVGKAEFGACPKCGSKEADEYADGTARCADCGQPLAAVEKKDDPDELEGVLTVVDEPLEGKAADTGEPADAPVPLTELELLMARREALNT